MSIYTRLDRLTADLNYVKEQLHAGLNTSQMQRTSVDGGAVELNDEDGNLKAILGEQFDGGNTINVVNGPTPPTPSGLTAEVDFGKIIASWDGTFENGAVAPTDWSRAEVHASQDPYFVPSRATARGSIVSAAGGEVTIGVLKGPWTIKMLAWSQAGKMSAPSTPVDVEVPGYGEIVQQAIDEAQELIDQAKQSLEQGQADLAEKITEAETALASLRETLDNLDDTTLPALRQDLDDAKGRLSEAESDLTNAFGEIASVRTSVDGKNKTTQSTSTPPAQYAGVVGDTWEVMSSMGSGGRTVSRWRWNGTVWVSILIGSEALGPVDGSKLTGEVNGSLVKPGSMYASSLVSGVSQNMVPDPGFVNSTINTARLTSARGYGDGNFSIQNGVLTISTTGTATGHPNMSLSANDDLYAWSAYPAMKVVAKAQARMASGAGQIVMVIRYKLRDGTLGSAAMGSYVTIGSAWNEYVWAYSLAQDVASFSIVLQVNRTTSNGVIEFRSPFVASAVSGSVLEDGAVDPAKLSTAVKDSITSAASKADAAMTAANGLAKVLHGTTDPSGTAPDGTIWWKHKDTLSGPVIGQWNRVSGSWVSTPISSDAMANLDVGKLTAGAGAIAELVSKKIAAAVGQFLELDVGQLTVTGTSQMADVVAQKIAAEVGEFIRLEVGQLVAGEGVMDEATIEKLFTDVVVAGIAQAEAFIGENAILTGAVTASKITASEELTAKVAEFLRVRAEMIEADAIDGMVITAPTIQSAKEGRRWVADIDSIRVLDDSEDVRTEIGPEGSTFKGEVEAESLVVNNGAEFRGVDNTIAQGSKLTIAAGVTDPTAPPIVQTYWDELPIVANSWVTVTEPQGLAWDGTSYVVAERNNQGQAVLGTKIYLRKFDGSTGETSGLTVELPGYVAGNSVYISEVFGVTCIGSEYFILGRYGYKFWVYVTNLSGTYLRRFEYEDVGYSQTNPLTYRPGIGNNGTNVVIAHCTDAGSLIWRTYNKTTGAKIATVDTGDNTKSNISGIYIGTADWGGGTYVTVAKDSTKAMVGFTTAGVYDTTRTFYADVPDTGVVFANGQFHSYNPAGSIRHYAGTSFGDGASDWWAVYSWAAFDDDADSVIDRWSRMSPMKAFTWPRRAKIKILGQPLPSGANFIMPSVAKKSTTPVRTDFHSPSWQIREGKSVAWWDTFPTDWATKASPHTTNNFPAATPAEITSASSTFSVKGDGSGRWGPLTFDAAGRMKGAVCAGEVLVTPTGSSGTRTGNAAVTFPAGRFSTAPTVVVSANTSVPGTTVVGVGAGGVTASGFTAYLARTNNTQTGIAWIATEGH